MSIKKQKHDRKLSMKPGSCGTMTNITDKSTPPLLSSLLHLVFMPFSVSFSLQIFLMLSLYMLLLSISLLQQLLDPLCSLIFLPSLKVKDVKYLDTDAAFIWVMIMAVPPLDPFTSPFRSTEKNQMPTLICIEPISFPPVTCKRGERLWIPLITTV